MVDGASAVVLENGARLTQASRVTVGPRTSYRGMLGAVPEPTGPEPAQEVRHA